ncbi:MAG: radical SAM protein [Myxococcales bacterium]|nr:radical SAM protein [Myxococcales bacterium]
MSRTLGKRGAAPRRLPVLEAAPETKRLIGQHHPEVHDGAEDLGALDSWDEEEDFEPSVPPEYAAGFEIRKQNFDNAIGFYAPALKTYETDDFSNCGMCSFVGVSVTGPACALQCDHCQANVLKPMIATTSPERLWEVAQAEAARGSGGLLISGGSDRKNVVRLHRFVDTMARIKQELGMRLLVHVGYADEELAQGLARASVDSVMLDIIGSDDTIREVYHLPWATTDCYRRTLEVLSAHGLPLSPHVVIGLHWGEIRGEYRALEMIAEFPRQSLVLVGLQPTAGTPMAHAKGPTPDAMGGVFREARQRFPSTSILLGCERPYGEAKRRTDELAVKAGLNGIAYPAEGIVRLAVRLGLQIRRSAMCCSLNFQEFT